MRHLRRHVHRAEPAGVDDDHRLRRRVRPVHHADSGDGDRGHHRGFTAVPQFHATTASVQAGDTISGQVVFTNSTGAARSVRLGLTVSGSGVTATLVSPAGPIRVPTGAPPSIPFTIAIDKDSATGPAVIVITAIDAATGQAYASVRLGFTVTRPPGFVTKWRWDFVALDIMLLLIIVGLLTLRARRRRKKSVSDLTAILRRDDFSLGTLQAPHEWSDVFIFVIRDESSFAPRLDWPCWECLPTRSGDPAAIRSGCRLRPATSTTSLSVAPGSGSNTMALSWPSATYAHAGPASLREAPG